jgi:hypothetical protein
MAMKEQQRSVYRSMQGKEVDMGKLMNQNEMTVAVGNVKVNARGDILGAGGQIVKTREEVLRESQPTQSVPNESAVPAESAVPKIVQPAEVTGIVKPAKKDVADMDPEGQE